MKVIDIKAFRKANDLTQKGLADYLGIDKGFISAIEHGKSKFPKAKLTLLLNNPHNWDISMLTQSENPVADEPKEDGFIEYLKSQIEDLKSLVSQLNEEKADLLRENAVLEYQIMMYAPKGERIAENAAGSLSADAV